MRENARTRAIDNHDIASRASRDRANQAMQVIAYCASRTENLSRCTCRHMLIIIPDMGCLRRS